MTTLSARPPTTSDPAMDMVSHLLHTTRVHSAQASISSETLLCLEPSSEHSTFLYHQSGELRVALPNGSIGLVNPGELMFFPHLRWQPEAMAAGNADSPSSVVGELVIENRKFCPWLSQLPPVLTHPRECCLSHHLQPLVMALSEETQRSGPGTQTVRDQLALLLVQTALQHWLNEQPAPQGDLRAALRDPDILAALLAVHGALDRPWTLAELAGHARMGRSKFASRFREVTGYPPLTYLTRNRLYSAARLLSTLGADPEAVARRVGYGSSRALRRAFGRYGTDLPNPI